MPIAVRNLTEPGPSLGALAGLTVQRVDHAALMAALQQRAPEEMARRLEAGHRAYVALMNGEPAAWGWVATRAADIGELRASFAIPEGDRYLWNFVTLAPFRGLGIYPRLLDAIVRAESEHGRRFWIAYAPENHASGAGIRKAGFTTVAELSFDDEGRPAVRAISPDGGAAARIFGVPEASEPLAQCWRCARAGRPGMKCAPDSCACDYQVPKSGCAA